MAGIYRPRHRVLYIHLLATEGGEDFDLLAEFFKRDYAVVDRIINHLKLVFVASKPPPPQVAFQELLMAAEAGEEYFL
jgi:hypothetical protein